MGLYFAYGSNMSRKFMRRLCPAARALGPASLSGWRFAIVASGFASIKPAPGGAVHGVLWRLSPRDRAVLDTYEDVESGLYRRRVVPVRHRGRLVPAMVYVGRGQSGGRATSEYCRLVIEAARDWELPIPYQRELGRRMSPRRLSKQHSASQPKL
ncbi:gamma-glutamylcyclotransferase family protein [Bradyrhizobium sp.]|uniref:gamma-glutamylcyclotransferase family protein n=1 Tax=Bradyrhizobium sp. TaxID=376 RepID=UPI002D2FEC55|nr:gamma-glutamylcyclotransferase family protein [Bradyrhizobium sp.]HZR73044.1 gamma-glutamylcyclotransferase family protein [Bradyrhizobium sp.]